MCEQMYNMGFIDEKGYAVFAVVGDYGDITTKPAKKVRNAAILMQFTFEEAVKNMEEASKDGRHLFMMPAHE